MNIKHHSLEKPLNDLKFYFEKRSARDFTASDYQHFFDLLTQSKPYRVDIDRCGKIRLNELLCFYLYCQDVPYWQIGEVMRLSESSVKTYIRRAISGLSAKTVQRAQSVMLEIGLIQPVKNETSQFIKSMIL